MQKQILTKEYMSTLTFVSNSSTSLIFKTKDGEIVKLFKPEILLLYKTVNIDLEGKLLNKEKYYISKEIIKPNTIYYTPSGQVCVFKTITAKGIDFNAFETKFTLLDRTDIKSYNERHKKLEGIIKKNKDIVFPDFCTCDNIYVTKDGNFELIDFDGLQIGKYKAIEMSTTLHEERNDYYVPKYWKNNLFTKNLDKKSLIILYFLEIFNVDLNKVGMISPLDHKVITLGEIFNLIGLEDYEIYEKVSKIFDDSKDNEYLEDSIDKIEKDYSLFVYPESRNGIYLKRLIKR